MSTSGYSLSTVSALLTMTPKYSDVRPTLWLIDLLYSFLISSGFFLELVGESASRQIDRLLLAVYNSIYPTKKCRGTYWKQCPSYFSHVQFVGIWGSWQKKRDWSCSQNLRLCLVFFLPMIPLHFWRVTGLIPALLLVQDFIPPNANNWNSTVHILGINSYKNISNASIT